MSLFISHFAGCSRVCAYVHILSDGHFGWLFSGFLTCCKC